ncbi:MAG: DUF4032 domain-containing protein [Candidatus Sericytochromatia bacterium]
MNEPNALFVSALRPGHPDFLDLPWALPLENWEGQCLRLESLPVGLSRHPVVFVNYAEGLYALKELPPELAEKEYALLRQMEDKHLPVVQAVGHLSLSEHSILITRYLDHSLPYRSLFLRQSLKTYRNSLLDAIASLLVQLHLAGVYWGDCSLSNALFRRDAGTLQAYLVDAETSEMHESLSESLRQYELDVMEENISGSLADLAAMGALPADYPIFETGAYIRERYERLWAEINREEIVRKEETYRIQERIRALNNLGFSVDEVVLQTASEGEKLRMRATVTDRNFHKEILHSLTGLEAEEQQARKMMNEIQELRAHLANQHNRSTPVSVAAYQWLNQTYQPVLDSLLTHPAVGEPLELYCQILEHKWYLSEQAQEDVGHQKALQDYLAHILPQSLPESPEFPVI